MFSFTTQNQPGSPDYTILPLRGEFRVPETEQAYRVFSLQRTQTSLRIALGLCSLLYLMCWLADLRAAGFTPAAFYGLGSRAAFGVAAVVLLQLLRRWPESTLAPVLIACAGDLVGGAVFMALALFIPAEIPTLEIATLLVVLAMYVLMPNRLLCSVCFAALYSVTFLLIARSKPGYAVDLFTEGLYLASTNVACWVIALRQNVLLRADFRSTMRLREQASRDHLRIVLLEEEASGSRQARTEHQALPPDHERAAPDDIHLGAMPGH